MSDPAPPLSLADLRVEHFQPLLGERFVVEFSPGRPVEAALAEVTVSPRARPLPSGRLPFSVLFRVPGTTPDPSWPQGMVIVTHPALGRFELCVTALGPDGPDAAYHAVFS